MEVGARQAAQSFDLHAAIQDAMREPWQRSHTQPAFTMPGRPRRRAMMLIRNLDWWITAADHNEVAERHSCRCWPPGLAAEPRRPISRCPRFLRARGAACPAQRSVFRAAIWLFSLTQSGGAPLGLGAIPAKPENEPPYHARKPAHYSVGPGPSRTMVRLPSRTRAPGKEQTKDIVFEIPPLSSNAGAKLNKGRGQNVTKD